MRPIRKQRFRRGGFAQIIALLVLCIFTVMAVSFASSSNMNLQSSSNYSGSAQARLVAESGLAFMLNVLRDMSLPPSTTESNLLASLQNVLATELGPTANLSAGSVSYAGGAVNAGPIALDDGSFLSSFKMVGGQCQLTVTGSARNFSSKVGMSLDLTERASGVFDYGVASRGQISISGSAVLAGMTDDSNSEASILSTRAEPFAIEAGGQATIGGDLFVTGEEGYVVLYGSGLSIGGTDDFDEIIEDHVHLGVTDPEWPEVDTTPFPDMTRSVIDETTDLSEPDLVFSNVRIMRGTDPNFSNVELNGVVYIEAPNKVTFTGSVTIKGIIVTEEDEAQVLEDCQIEFSGHVSAPGVDALPDTDEFAEVKLHSGTAILAPGFGVTFRGSSFAVNGTIAADELSFLGNMTIEGDIEGSVLGLKDRPMTLSGNCGLRFNRANADSTPAGFFHPLGLNPLADSYAELAGGS